MKNRAKVLFLDDDMNVLEGFSDALKRTELDVFTAHTVEKAFTILKVEKIDVVVSDERMPGMPGHEFLDRVSSRFPSTIRILLSGQATPNEIAAAINEGQICKYLIKPIKQEDLIFVLYEVLEAKKYVTQNYSITQNSVSYKRSMDALELSSPGITKVNRDENGYIILD